ncbi:MAG: hypothetical protein RLZZ28_1607, partial [Bacteroidota bacterium]
MNALKSKLLVLALFHWLLALTQPLTKFQQLRCFSATGPVMAYWQHAAVQKTFLSDLSRTLQQFQLPALSDTVSLKVEYLAAGAKIDKVKPAITGPEESGSYQLFLDMYEVEAAYFFKYADKEMADSAMMKRTRSVFIIEATLFKNGEGQVFNEILNIALSNSQTPGMGSLYGNAVFVKSISTTPIGFTEMLKAATRILFDPKNDLAMVEIKVPPAFLSDNYIQPLIHQQPRIFVTENKGIASFQLQQQTEMIRFGMPIYQEIKIKGKKPEKYPDTLEMAIKNSTNYEGSDFVFLHQECRDVVRDKNYGLTLTTQINPDIAIPGEGLFTHFLPGPYNWLFLEKDTVAVFSIDKWVISSKNSQILYPDKISNGFDTSAVLTIADPF